MNIDGLVVATLIFACVFLLLSILMIEIHGITGFFIELQASLSGLGKNRTSYCYIDCMPNGFFAF